MNGAERSQACTERRIDSDGALWLWFKPQIGGYCTHARARWDTGCLTVEYFTDGEFPCDEPTSFHHCSAIGFVEFGVAILEAMLKSPPPSNGNPHPTAESVARLREALNAVIEEP